MMDHLCKRLEQIAGTGRNLLLAAAALAIFTDSASATDFMVKYDQAKLLRLAEPAASVIIGNPSIADVALKNRTLLVVTGKTFGVTNLIVLDANNQVVMERQLVVRSDDRRIVNLTRGGKRSTYNCSPKCQPVLTIGDEAIYYKTIASASEAKMKFSVKSAASGMSGGGRN